MQPVGEQAACSHSRREAREVEIPCGLQEAEGYLESAEGMFDTYASGTQLCVVCSPSLHLCLASASLERHLWLPVSCSYTIVCRVSHIAQKEQIRMEEQVTGAKECSRLAASLGRVAAVDVANQTCKSGEQISACLVDCSSMRN